MGEAAIKFISNENDVATEASDVKAILFLVVLFGGLILGWAISFPPIFYHLFM